MDAKTFFETYAPFAVQEQKRSGIPASITLSQAALESGYGGSGLAQRAFNFFGIKVGSGWSGGTYFTPTTEMKGGSIYTEMATFRKYNNAGESFADHSDFLKNNKRYSGALAASGDPLKMADELQKAGYATDPAYASKLKKIINTYGLTGYDQPGAAVTPAPQQGETKTASIFTNPNQFFSDLAGKSLTGIAILFIVGFVLFMGYKTIGGTKI